MCALDGKDPSELAGMIDALMGEVERNKESAKGLFIKTILTNQIDATKAEEDYLKAENERLKADAERYRKLAAYLVSDSTELDDQLVEATTVEELSNVIDAAMKGAP